MNTAAQQGRHVGTPRLRAETSDDLPFLRLLYATTRAEELDQTGWDEATRAAFLAMQFSAQRQHYTTHYPDAAFDIIELDGQAVGRLYVRRNVDIVLMDIALLPPFRDRGVGTRLMESLFEDSERSGRAISLHVETNNRRGYEWYRRLGFADVERGPMHIAMRREAGSQ